MGVGGKWKTRDGGVETGGGDGSEMGSVMEEGKKSMTCLNASLSLDFEGQRGEKLVTYSLN